MRFHLPTPPVKLSAVKNYQHKLRRAALAFLGDKCVRCGFTDLRALQIDHVHGGGTKEAHAIGPQAMQKRVLSGDPSYQLLCANCNWIKRHENHEY